MPPGFASSPFSRVANADTSNSSSSSSCSAVALPGVPPAMSFSPRFSFDFMFDDASLSMGGDDAAPSPLRTPLRMASLVRPGGEGCRLAGHSDDTPGKETADNSKAPRHEALVNGVKLQFRTVQVWQQIHLATIFPKAVWPHSAPPREPSPASPTQASSSSSASSASSSSASSSSPLSAVESPAAAPSSSFSVSFPDLVHGRDRLTVAQIFFELLVLTHAQVVDLRQEEPTDPLGLVLLHPPPQRT
eukprot:GHVT01029288.1.p1 GENE.GHVT01029288.1~~GHVT01029288.1.p1  ORF type:complete len:246 (+),score=98.12 GHVT01029288.1:2-739(+)